jgi:phosphoglycolate phosphatase
VIRNIIFDWSGTLVDDLPAVWRATNHVLTQAGREPMTLEQFRAEFCLPFTKFYDRHVPHVALPQLEVWFHEHFREAQESVVELPHARQFLEFCRSKGMRTFLLSTVHKDYFAIQARVIGFAQFLDRPYLGVVDKLARIHSILEENQLDPAETLFIGDMQHDIDTARHGGVHSCGVLTGYNGLDQLRASKPDVIVEHLGELREILEAGRLELTPHAPGSDAHRAPVVTVGALIFNEADEVLMVRTHKWSDLWGIPGGKVKWGEDSVAALRRETLEETNLKITKIRFALVQDCIHSPEFYKDAHFVLLNYTAYSVFHENVKLNDEAREFRWVTISEALKMPVNRPTRVLLDYAARRRPWEENSAGDSDLEFPEI